MALIDEDNIGVLHKLHPPSLGLDHLENENNPGATTRGSLKNRKRVTIDPRTIVDVIGNLKRGKAGGFELDSLDIFIKLISSNQRAKKNKMTQPFRADILA